ncbi:CBS domain-containing protein [Solirhodobacter olei]|uniref:CBS domain-containing protein n=1 Tax=Solirhodobacter olei TaxID=2493082 RepID=UPI000FD96190|nr:CBS domain-containing protein [Solirhodobacter olei]
MIVQEILNGKPSAEVVTVPPGSTVAEAVELLSARRIGALIVSEDGRHVAGILSERDVVRELGRQGPGCLSLPVEELMTAEIVGCNREDSAESVLERMTEGRFRHMPVMHAGAMVGMISIGDVVKARLQQLSMERDALEGMIKGY